MEAAFGAIRDEFGMPTPWAEHEFIMTQEESEDKDNLVTVFLGLFSGGYDHCVEDAKQVSL
jgi:hypothetical protein